MRLGSILASAAALAMTAAPLVANAAPAVRTGTAVEGENLNGLAPIWLAALAIALAVGIYLIVDDDDEDLPVSP